MNIYLIFAIFFFLTINSTTNGIAIDDFHCKVPTCRDFYYVNSTNLRRKTVRYFQATFSFQGLKKYPNHKKYVDVCYDTVFGLQGVPKKEGKCVNEKTGNIMPNCICEFSFVLQKLLTFSLIIKSTIELDAVAELIRDCMNKLEGTSAYEKKYYCGYTLMKYCAVHVGLERFPINWAPSQWIQQSFQRVFLFFISIYRLHLSNSRTWTINSRPNWQTSRF